MKNLKNLVVAFAGLLILSSCEKETVTPDKDNGTTPRKNITTGLDFDLATGEEFTAHAWAVTDKTNYDVEVSGINDPNYNELERGGIWDHNRKGEQKWNYEAYGAVGGDFYEPLPAGTYLLHFITKGPRDKQTSSYTSITVEQGKVTKIRYKTKPTDKYYQPWRK